MHILCDTSSLMMLLRIASDLFTDPRYECVTVQQVYEEYTQTQKFKTKYPWRDQYKKHVRARPRSVIENDDYRRALRAIILIESTAMNERTGQRFSLSRRDREIGAGVVAHKYTITATDRNLVDFLDQKFEVGSVAPLGLVNDWLEKTLFKWDDFRQSVLDDWIVCNERPQPTDEIARFEKLTGRKYPK